MGAREDSKRYYDRLTADEKRAKRVRNLARPGRSEEQRLWHRMWRTGFTPKLLAELREYQMNGCAICRAEFGEGAARRECCDHDHVTRKPRGLLCGACNTVLGYYEKHQRQHMLIEQYEKYLDSTPASLFY